MVDALYDRTVIDIKATSSKSNDFYGFRTTGNVLKFEGFQAVYSENKDEDSIEDEDNIEDEGKDKNLPKLTDGQELLCTKLQDEQKFTQPPARFSEASLINSLEKEGVGRPSTYASTISTIQDREYVLLEKGRLHPTLLGKAVTGFLTEHFENVLNVEFTSLMEKKLDLIAEGSLKWNPMVLEFYEPFNKVVESVLQDAPRVDYRLLEEKTDMVCEKCESPMVIKTGRNGRFVACSGFPDCKNAISLTLSILGIDVRCPKCNQGELAEKKKTKGNKRFYGCLNYPDCDFAINSIPFSQPCPECSWLLIASGTSSVRCSSKECGYRGSQKDLDRLQKELT
jgi:DNA topoisomerase-1